MFFGIFSVVFSRSLRMSLIARSQPNHLARHLFKNKLCLLEKLDTVQKLVKQYLWFGEVQGVVDCRVRFTREQSDVVGEGFRLFFFSSCFLFGLYFQLAANLEARYMHRTKDQQNIAQAVGLQ